MRADLDALEAAAGYRFADREILQRALTHSSHVHEHVSQRGPVAARDNEQLEFLGDAVLGFVVSWEITCSLAAARNSAGDARKKRSLWMPWKP